MRTLTRNEKVLGGLFLALAVGLVLLVLASTARRWVQQGQTARRELQARIAEAQQWLDEEPLWRARADWLRANPLPPWHAEESEAELIQNLQASLAREGITINSQRLLTASEQPGQNTIGAELSLKGTTTQIVRWLHGIQQPGEFLTIRQINLRADADKTNLRADVSLVRHYGDASGEGNQPTDLPVEPALLPESSPESLLPGGTEILPTEPAVPSTPEPIPQLGPAPQLNPPTQVEPAESSPDAGAFPPPLPTPEQPDLVPMPIPEDIPATPAPEKTDSPQPIVPIP